jgi:hypothetical protein
MKKFGPKIKSSSNKNTSAPLKWQALSWPKYMKFNEDNKLECLALTLFALVVVIFNRKAGVYKEWKMILH